MPKIYKKAKIRERYSLTTPDRMASVWVALRDVDVVGPAETQLIL